MRLWTTQLRFLALCALVLTAGCTSKEEKKTIDTLNRHDQLVARNAFVKTIEFADESQENTTRFEADIYNTSGEVIGRLKGRRVQGFGTMVQAVKWNDDPSTWEAFDETEEQRQERRRQEWRKRRRERFGGGDNEEPIGDGPP